jgi:hypothetical protein
MGVQFGYVLTSLDDIDWRSIVSNFDTVPSLLTADIKLPWNSVYDTNGDIYIRQSKPYPCTVLAIVPKVKVFGD